MTNYEYVMSIMTPEKLAKLHSSMDCSGCPIESYHQQCFTIENIGKSCYDILIDWLYKEHEEKIGE